MKLPTEKTQPKTDLRDYSILLYGPPKIGKTTLCSNAENAIFLATEPGLNALSAYQMDITTWEEFRSACGLLAKGEHGFKTVIVDTVDNLHKMCSKHMRELHGFEHESDLGFGKGWGYVSDAMRSALTFLAQLPYGLICVSHSQAMEYETRTGKHTKITSSLSGSPRGIVEDLVDMILFCDYEATEIEGSSEYRRVIRTDKSPHYEAGDRTGRLPAVVGLNYGELVAAFARGQDSDEEQNQMMQGE